MLTEALAGRSVLVTGGAGFVGSHVVERLLRLSARVTVVDNFDAFYSPALKRRNVASFLECPGFRLFKADILDDVALAEVFSSDHFGGVIHLAARPGVRDSIRDPLLYQRANIEGTYRVLESTRRAGVRKFVFASSSSVYGSTDGPPMVENDSSNIPVSPYAATKAAGEAACCAYAHAFGATRVVCLRFFSMYGPRGRPDQVVQCFTSLLLRGLPVTIYGDGTSTRDFIYIDDAVTCVVKALLYEGTASEIVNVGTGSTASVAEVVNHIGRAAGVVPRIEYGELHPGDARATRADVNKARILFDFEARITLPQGVKRLVRWARLIERQDCAVAPAVGASGRDGERT